MKVTIKFTLFITCIVFIVSACTKTGWEKPVDEEEDDTPSYDGVFQADPAIIYHEGLFYLYGTNDTDPNQGFQVYTSADMEIWEGPKGVKDGYALRKEDVFGDVGFWAPQVWLENGLFYMAYTANENIAIATSEHPLGPFVQSDKQPLAGGIKQIDPFVYHGGDGGKYLFHVRLIEGNRIFVVELEDDYTGIREETLAECLIADQPWENRAEASWPVAEGPTVIKRGELYYLFYSANDFRHPEYAVGYATSNQLTGPWEKAADNPILGVHNTGWPGSGHGDLFMDHQGEYHYVFHTHYVNNQVIPRRTAIVPVSFEPDGAGFLKPRFRGEDMFHIQVQKK